jgi:hypothetical protein
MIRAILLKTIPVAVFALGFGYLQTATSAPQPTSERALIDQYCVGCHNQRLKTADLMLDKAIRPIRPLIPSFGRVGPARTPN